jgi:hypothetical protein
MPNIVGKANPFTQSSEPEWAKPQTLIEIARTNQSPAKPQRPHKPSALSQQISPTGNYKMEQQGSTDATDDRNRAPTPLLPPRPPTWGAGQHGPEAGMMQPKRVTTDLLDEVDPVMEKWKPLQPHR